jgi:hypothetical protein
MCGKQHITYSQFFTFIFTTVLQGIVIIIINYYYSYYHPQVRNLKIREVLT